MICVFLLLAALFWFVCALCCDCFVFDSCRVCGVLF